jgi:hypothetical protein
MLAHNYNVREKVLQGKEELLLGATVLILLTSELCYVLNRLPSE